MAHDEFEKELFRNLDAYQSDLNIDKEWKELEQRMPENRKRRMLPFWFIGLASLVLITGIYFYCHETFRMSTAAEQNSKILSSQKETKDSEVQSPTVESADANLITEASKKVHSTSGALRKEKYAAETLTKTESTVINTNLEVNQKTSNKNFSNKTKEPSKSIKNDFLDVNEKTTPILNNSILKNDAKQDDLPKDILQKDIAKSIVKNISDTALSKPKEPNASLFNLPAIPIYLNYEKGNTELPIDYTKNQFSFSSKKKKVKKPWSIALAYTYGRNRFNRNASLDGLQGQIDFLSQFEESVDYMSLQFKVYKNLNKNLSVFSGIQLSQHVNLFSFKDAFLVEREDPNALLVQNFYLSGNVEETYGEGITVYDVDIQSNLWQQYQSIGIPLGISIHSDLDKNWSAQFDVATVVHPFQNIIGRKIFRPEEDYYVFNNNTYSSKTFFILENQINLNWRLTKTFSVQLGTDMGIDLDSRLNTEDHYSMKFSYIGLRIGGHFTF